MSQNPFRLPVKPDWLASSVEQLLSLDVLANYYDERPQAAVDETQTEAQRFLDHTMDSIDVAVEVMNRVDMDNVPREGATLFIANHPFGGLEGVAMSRELLKVRPDLKVLTNELLSLIPEFKDLFIGVDVLSDKAAEKNMRGMREVLKHMKRGGALLIFPAGMVSAIETPSFKIKDRPWNAVVAKLMRQFKADCVPFYVHWHY